MFQVSNQRIILPHSKVLEKPELKKIKGANHSKNRKGFGDSWSFPLDKRKELESLLSATKQEYELEDAWYDIFPEFKFLKQ